MHIMIDLETMGTRPDAPIIAIGAVKFTAMGVTDQTFYTNVDLASAVKDGGAVIDPDTLMWWMQQSDEARQVLLSGASPLRVALHDFTRWVKDTDEPKGVWGNGASFDNVILSETYKRVGMEPPWKFWNDRCYRTVKNMFPACKMERIGTHHNALDDAESQAEHLLRICEEFGDFL